MVELLLGTGNAHKARELSALLGDLPFLPRTLRDFPELEGVEEDGATFEENARKKALAYAKGSGLWSLADDSGLAVDALKGEPGVRSARYAGPGQDDEANNRKLLKELAGVPPKRRTAQFRCALALASPSGEVSVESGRVKGEITEDPRGEQGFGYDPLFLLPALGKTMAELTFEEKLRVSHRAHAMSRMKPHLEELVRPRPGEVSKSCPRCGLDLDPWHCRLVCPGCGYQEDCSDTALP